MFSKALVPIRVPSVEVSYPEESSRTVTQERAKHLVMQRSFIL